MKDEALSAKLVGNARLVDAPELADAHRREFARLSKVVRKMSGLRAQKRQRRAQQAGSEFVFAVFWQTLAQDYADADGETLVRDLEEPLVVEARLREAYQRMRRAQARPVSGDPRDTFERAVDPRLLKGDAA